VTVTQLASENKKDHARAFKLSDTPGSNGGPGSDGMSRVMIRVIGDRRWGRPGMRPAAAAARSGPAVPQSQ
jgi:hypothetical protein